MLQLVVCHFRLLTWKIYLLPMILLQVKGFEIIKGVHLEPQPFDLERDLATPTFKLKRPQLLKYYQVLTHFRVGNTKSFTQVCIQIRHLFINLALVRDQNPWHWVYFIQVHFREAQSKVDNRYLVTFLVRTPIRYVNIIWFVFHVPQLLPVRFTQQYSSYIIKSTMKRLQKPDWKSVLLLSSYGYRKCMFVDFLIGYIGPPNCVHYLSVQYLLIFEDVVDSPLNMCLSGVCSLILTEPHTNQNLGIQLSKQIT